MALIFFLKKGEDPRYQFRDLVVLVKKAVEKNSYGRALGITQRIISEMINFSSDPEFCHRSGWKSSCLE